MICSKKAQRQLFKEKRNQLSEAYRKDASKQIHMHIFRSETYKEATAVLSYSSFGSEVDTYELNEQILRDGKKLFLPKTYNEKHFMEFYQVESMKDLKAGFRGILEPRTDIPFSDEENAWMLVPGLAYDDRMYRMGYGGGFYDRYIMNHPKIATCMLAFSYQKTDMIMTEPHDKAMTHIMTEFGQNDNRNRNEGTIWNT